MLKTVTIRNTTTTHDFSTLCITCNAAACKTNMQQHASSIILYQANQCSGAAEAQRCTRRVRPTTDKLNWRSFRADTLAWPRRLKDSLKHMLMSEIEIMTDGGRRRRWSAAEKLRIVEETMVEGESISVVARRNGVAPNLLYRWHEEGSENSVGRCFPRRTHARRRKHRQGRR
jgi:hypothetical protein